MCPFHLNEGRYSYPTVWDELLCIWGFHYDFNWLELTKGLSHQNTPLMLGSTSSYAPKSSGMLNALPPQVLNFKLKVNRQVI